MRLQRTDSSDPDFLRLVRLLDAELAELDGEDHAFYSLYNNVDRIRYVVLCYKDSELVGCGGMKKTDPAGVEIKRMYVDPDLRGQGVATQILTELEKWAYAVGIERIVLETGKRQPDAIHLYEKNGYQRIPNFGPYKGVENSVCFEKHLTK